MPADIPALVEDLRAEHADLDGLVASLVPEGWDTPTPAPGWTVRDQVSHLAFFDARAVMALVDPGGFAAEVEALRGDPAALMEAPVLQGRSLSPAEVLGRWRRGREELCRAVLAAEPGRRVPWYGPPMGLASCVSARLMETWVHGQDVADGLALDRVPTPRLRHLAHLAVRARPFNYALHGRPLPKAPVHVGLAAPQGGTWSWEDPALPDRVLGTALDFCLVVTQRRHPADTGLVVEGDLAREWIAIAQAFAGPPGAGRRPGQFPRTGAAGR